MRRVGDAGRRGAWTAAALLVVIVAAGCADDAGEAPAGSAPVGPTPAEPTPAAPTRVEPTPAEPTPERDRDQVTTAGGSSQTPTESETAASETTESETTADAGCAGSDGWIAQAQWVEVDQQPTLRITPTELLRECGMRAGADAGWQQVLTLAPESDTAGMRAQYLCHVGFAPNKDVWNLEPWRPEVSTVEMVRSQCNPEPTPP